MLLSKWQKISATTPEALTVNVLQESKNAKDPEEPKAFRVFSFQGIDKCVQRVRLARRTVHEDKRQEERYRLHISAMQKLGKGIGT